MKRSSDRLRWAVGAAVLAAGVGLGLGLPPVGGVVPAAGQAPAAAPAKPPAPAPAGKAEARPAPAAPHLAPASPEAVKFFEAEVAGILKAHCLNCHGADKPKGGLRLDSREAVLKGGESGPVVDFAKPEASPLIEAINYASLEMPPKGKLPAKEIAVLTKWVKMGVPYSAEPTHHGPPPVDAKARAFWAFKPVTRPAVPAVKDAARVRNPVDAFVLAKLEEKGWKPAPAADKAALLRRVTYVVTGLPPTPAEVDAFLADGSDDAYEKVVDRLLASPRRGEHRARQWLDLVRYAESNSYERDGSKPNAWKYRDYVIQSFNADKPYDRFVREQLAGDEIAPEGRDELIATGYYMLGIWDDEPADKHVRDEDQRVSVFDWYDDVVSTTGQTFLGLTIGCARCHDHKIDPIPQKDYYRLLAFVRNIKMFGPGSASQRPLATPADMRKQQAAIQAWQARVDALTAQMKVIEDALAAKLSGGEKDDFAHEGNRPSIIRKNIGRNITRADADRHRDLAKQRDEVNKDRPGAAETALAVAERGGPPRDVHVLGRGLPSNKGEKVTPGFPSVLTAPDAPSPVVPQRNSGPRTTGLRTALADWLVDGKNPLPARVMVNRIFQNVFGRGIVRSSSNFGYMGTPPTHPELLDWMASEFVAGGWSIRRMERLLLTSNTFRMSAQAAPPGNAAATDPENDLLWKFDSRRLTSEEIRDSILAACGNLNLAKTEGPSVYPVIPPEVLAGQSVPGKGWGKSTPAEAASRSVFVFVKRSLAVPQLAVFDSPDPDSPCAQRFTTTQPTQALVMLNSVFINDQAKLFAETIARTAGEAPEARVAEGLRRVIQRRPTEAEIARGVKFLADSQGRDNTSPAEALRRFCVVLLNFNEFVFVD